MDDTSAVALATTEPHELPPVLVWPRYNISDFTNRIICGNCVNVMREMPSATVDFVLTDPPYGSRYRDRSQRTVTNDDSTTWIGPSIRRDRPRAEEQQLLCELLRLVKG